MPRGRKPQIDKPKLSELEKNMISVVPHGRLAGNENMQKGDNAKFIKHSMIALDLPPVDIRDVNQVAERVRFYLDSCIKDDMRPTVAGVCLFIGIDVGTFWSWGSGRTQTKDHVALYKRIKALMNSIIEQQMAHGKLNPVSAIFLLKCHFGYQETNKIEVTTKKELPEAKSEDVLKAQYIEALPDD